MKTQTDKQLMDPTMAKVFRAIDFLYSKPIVNKCRPVQPPFNQPRTDLFDDPTHNGQYYGD